MFRRKRSSEDFAEEIRSHLELEADELRAEGLSDEDARRRARVEFGNAATSRERFYLRSRIQWLDRLVRDLRHGLRSLLHSPGFALTAILTLALGIGANTAVFSVMNAVLLRSLPVTDPTRLFYLRTSNVPHGTGTISSRETFSYPVYQTLRDRHPGLADVIAYVPLSVNKVAVRYGTQPEEAEGDMVSGTFFSGLGVKLPHGRGFTEQDEKDHAPIAVISYSYWTRRFARNPEVLGTTLFVNGIGFTIVGISAEGFEGLEAGSSTDFWIPFQNRPELNAYGNPVDEGKIYITDPTWWCLRLIARLAPGVNPKQAAAALNPLFQHAAYIGLGSPAAGEKPPTLSLEEAKGFPGYSGEYGRPLRMLMTMVGFVLLIALTNVVMLLMARNATRQREFSMRMALGAGRSDLLGQLLAESLLLVTTGGVLAWVFANVATRALASWAQIESSLAPDRTVLAFALGILVMAALIFGLAPLRIALAAGPALSLKTSAATSNTEAGRARGARIMVALQMMVCVVLLVGAGLLVGTLRNLENAPLGMRVDGLVVFGVNPHVTSVPQGKAFYRGLIGKLRELPGVQSVTVMEWRIGSWSSNNSDMTIEGRLPDVPNGSSRTVRTNVVGPGFFTTLGVPVLAGRDFADSDTETSPHVGIINQQFAERFFPNQNPLGHMIGTEDGRYQMTVIGVVKDHKYRSIDEEPIPMAWFEYAQIPIAGRMDVEMRVNGDPLSILPAARKVVQQMDPNLPLIKPMTQRDQYLLTISSQILFARLAGFFGLLAIVLVATGLYGTLAYRVSKRTAEIGVRMALGARRGQVVWMILRDSLLLAAFGVLAGAPLAYLLGRALSSSLYGIKPLDSLTYGIAIVAVSLVALAASAAPASRAASIDPQRALRAE
jgi:predicted permease